MIPLTLEIGPESIDTRVWTEMQVSYAYRKSEGLQHRWTTVSDDTCVQLDYLILICLIFIVFIGPLII